MTAHKVLLVTPRYFPLMGGVETHVYEVARRMAARGIDTTVLTTDPGNTLPPLETRDGVTIRRVRAYPANLDLYVAPAIYNVVAEGDWDVVHCQGFHTFVPPIAMLAAQRAGIPYLLSFHSGGHSSGLRHSIRGLQSAAMRPLLSGADALVAVSQFEADLFAQRLHLPPERFVVVPNGSHLPKVVDLPPVDADSPLILSVGRLERYKGHHRVIQALPGVLAQMPNARLRILGGGPYEAELRKLTAELGLTDKVEIGAMPPENRQGMASIVAQAALVVLLSDYEAHPISVMEALAMKRSVLVTDTSGLGELARRGLVRAIPLDSSSEVVANAIVDQLHHPMVAPDVELPTWDQCVDSLVRLYGDVARPSRAA